MILVLYFLLICLEAHSSLDHRGILNYHFVWGRKEYVNNTQNRGIKKPWSVAGYEKTRIIYEDNIMKISHINLYII